MGIDLEREPQDERREVRTVMLLALDGQPDIALGDDVMVVGRDPTCDLQMSAPQVSRLHCLLLPSGNELRVRDLGSTNGLRINGQRTRAGLLRPGDELTIVNVRYRLCPIDAPWRRTLAC